MLRVEEGTTANELVCGAYETEVVKPLAPPTDCDTIFGLLAVDVDNDRTAPPPTPAVEIGS